MERFRVIVITPPEIVSGEAAIINSLLSSGAAERVHLRHPDADCASMRAILEEIPQALRRRVSLHSHFSLAEECGAGGIHLNSRSPQCSGSPEFLSISCHTLEEAETAARSGRFSYITLSPVYDSISKPGYTARLSPGDATLRQMLERNRTQTDVIALGGVTPEKFPELRAAGFAGAAMLGHVWNNIVTEKNIR